MAVEIIISKSAPADTINVLKFIKKAHSRHYDTLPPIIDMFALPWVTNVICFGTSFNATVGGRIVASIGMMPSSFPWNNYEQRLSTEWLHVLDDFLDTGVRDRLIVAVKHEAVEQERAVDIFIPEYMKSKKDSHIKPIGKTYSFLV